MDDTKPDLVPDEGDERGREDEGAGRTAGVAAAVDDAELASTRSQPAAAERADGAKPVAEADRPDGPQHSGSPHKPDSRDERDASYGGFLSSDVPPAEHDAGAGHGLPPDDGPYFHGADAPEPEERDWGMLLHRVRVPITLTLLLVLLAGAAWYGWQALLGEETSNRDRAECVTPSPGSKQEVSATDVSVNVYNAGSVSGLADRTAERLSSRGFTISEVANDPDEDRVATAEIRGRAKDAPEVRLLAAQVDGAKVQPDSREEAEVDLVVGDDFDSLNKQAPTTLEVETTTPMCQTPGPSPGGDAEK